MGGDSWSWCDAVQAVMAIVTPVLGLGVVKHWLEKKLLNRINQEENANMSREDESNVQGTDGIRDFWKMAQENIPALKDRSIPTRRFWSIPYKSGIRLVYVVLEKEARVELYIDNGDDEWNLRTYNSWLDRKDLIEKRLGVFSRQVVWFSRPNSRAKGIGLRYDASGLGDRNGWKAIVDFYKMTAPSLMEAIS